MKCAPTSGTARPLPASVRQRQPAPHGLHPARRRGAGLALGLALTHPDRVDGLILISGFPKGVLTHIRGPHLRFFARAGSGLLFGLGYRLLGRRNFRKFLSCLVWDRSLITPAVVERAYRLRKQYGKAQP